MRRMVRQVARALFVSSRGGFVLVALALAIAAWPGIVQAFKQRYHESLTETVLRGLGFDEDSADEVGDSNWWTDPNEPFTAAAHADNNELASSSQTTPGACPRISLA